MKTTKLTAFFAAVLMALGAASLRAQQIIVPNGLFDAPATSFALPFIVDWQSSPPETSGVFTNDPGFGPSEYLVNCVGGQAAFLYSGPGYSFFQDYNSVDSQTNTHTLGATFDAGKSYQLISGITGGAVEPLTQGTTLQMSLYYRNSSSNIVIVASTNIVYDTNRFTPTNFLYFQLDSPTVKSSDAWAGHHLGVQFASMATTANEGGTWDLNNVTLFATPSLVFAQVSAGHFGATLKSQPGSVYQILSSTNISTPLTNWTGVVTLTNTTGTIPFVDPAPTTSQVRFYSARQVSP